MDNKPEFDTICLSGGGIKGFSFIGALEYLQNNHYIDINKINTWAGTSAGSIISFLFTIGYSISDINEFIINFNFNKMQPEPDINNLFLSHGFDNGNKLVIILKEFLNQKFNVNNITFNELFNLTNKKLIVVGTNFSKGQETVFSYDKTPNMSVIDAVRISSSIPIIFTPVLYESDYYIDGAFVNNFPIKYCNPNSTLGIYIKNSCCNNLTNIFTLISGCVAIVSDTISTKDWNVKYPYVIEINNISFDFTNFNIDLEKKNKIINLGQTFAKKYLDNINDIKLNVCNTSTQTNVDYIDSFTQTD